MAGRRAAREGLYDDQAAAATWTCRLVVIGSIGIGRLALRLWPREQFVGARNVVGAGGVGQQAVVAERWKRLGRTWMRNRRMNSSVASVICLYRSRPSVRESLHLEVTLSLSNAIKRLLAMGTRGG